MTIEYYGGVEWDNLQIVETVDEEGEGRIEIIDEDNVFSLLGLTTEEEENRSQEQQASAKGGDGHENRNQTCQEEMDTVGAAIPVEDDVPGERILVYVPNNPCMDIGTVYPNMEEFRLAMRQYSDSTWTGQTGRSLPDRPQCLDRSDRSVRPVGVNFSCQH